MIFMVIVGIFTLGNSSDAFLVLRAQDLGVNVIGVLAMVATFNLIYALISTPAGSSFMVLMSLNSLRPACSLVCGCIERSAPTSITSC